jgi:hypothetical protein
VEFCKGNGRLYRDDPEGERRVGQALLSGADMLALTIRMPCGDDVWSLHCLCVRDFLMMSDPVGDDAIPYGCTVVNVILPAANTTHKILSPSNFQIRPDSRLLALTCECLAGVPGVTNRPLSCGNNYGAPLVTLYMNFTHTRLLLQITLAG